MIVTTNRLCFPCKPNSEEGASYVRIPTEEKIATGLTEDDVCEDSISDSDLPVYSLSSIRKRFMFLWLSSVLLWIFFFAMMCYTTWSAIANIAEHGRQWHSFTLPACFFALTLIYTPQVVTPSVRDVYGKYVNLRSGYTNMAGGKTIK